MPLSRRDQGSQARPARSEARPAAGRRRYPAAAARGRPRTRGQDDRQRRSDRRGGSAQERPDRGNRRRSGLRRRGLCPQGAGGEAPLAQAARRRLQARGGQGRHFDLHQCGRRPDQEGARARSAVRRRGCRPRRDRAAVRRRVEEGARRFPQAGLQRPVQGAALRVLLRARSRQDRRRARRHQAASTSSASPSSAPAPWAAVSRCRSPMPVFR